LKIIFLPDQDLVYSLRHLITPALGFFVPTDQIVLLVFYARLIATNRGPEYHQEDR